MKVVIRVISITRVIMVTEYIFSSESEKKGNRGKVANRREVIVLVGLLSADHNLIRIIKIFIG